MYEKWLKAFHMVASQGGFTRAARTLNVGQPTVSSHIKSIEDHFRVELFYRRGREIELTDTGKQLFEITQGLYGHEAEAISFLRSVGQNDRGLLRLGAVGPYDVMALADAFRRRYPRIDIAVTVAPRAEVMARLSRFELDVGVVADDVAEREFHSIEFDRHCVLVMVTKTHRLARGKSVRIAELAGERVILRDAASATRRAFEQMLARAAVRVIPIMEINSREAVREAVARGMGIGVVSEREFAPHESIRALRVRDGAMHTAAHVVCLAVRRHRPLIAAFLKVAAELARPLGRADAPLSPGAAGRGRPRARSRAS
jgi:aminoethylphosphonate catabolism LysR family transcriptional regulator